LLPFTSHCSTKNTTPVASLNLRNQAPLFTKLRLLQATSNYVFISDALHSVFILLESANTIVVLFFVLCIAILFLLIGFVLFLFTSLFLFELRKTYFSGCHGRWDGHVNSGDNEQIRKEVHCTCYCVP